MLETVVSPAAPPRAQVMGTAWQADRHCAVDGGRYAHDRYVSSFVVWHRIRSRLTVMIDEPTKGQYYGGVVAAPVFSAVISEALRMLRCHRTRRP